MSLIHFSQKSAALPCPSRKKADAAGNSLQNILIIRVKKDRRYSGGLFRSSCLQRVIWYPVPVRRRWSWFPQK
jgi:hypothetical protein